MDRVTVWRRRKREAALAVRMLAAKRERGEIVKVKRARRMAEIKRSGGTLRAADVALSADEEKAWRARHGLVVERRGRRCGDDGEQETWLSFAAAVVTLIRQRGQAPHFDLTEAKGGGRMGFIVPAPGVMEALRASGFSPSLLAFHAAEFGKVCRNRTADSNSATPRREASRAVYWTSVPGMKKELAAYCRNRAPHREAALALISSLCRGQSPAYSRQNESTVKTSRRTLIRPELLARLSPALRPRVEAKLRDFLGRNFQRPDFVSRFESFGRRLYGRALYLTAREAGGSLSRDDDATASAGARIVSDSIFARDAVEQWGNGDAFYHEIDARLGRAKYVT